MSSQLPSLAVSSLANLVVFGSLFRIVISISTRPQGTSSRNQMSKSRCAGEIRASTESLWSVRRSGSMLPQFYHSLPCSHPAIWGSRFHTATSGSPVPQTLRPRRRMSGDGTSLCRRTLPCGPQASGRAGLRRPKSSARIAFGNPVPHNDS